jgi:hypothetical protein
LEKFDIWRTFMKNGKKYFLTAVVVLLMLFSGGALFADEIVDPVGAGGYSTGDLITAADMNLRFQALNSLLKISNGNMKSDDTNDRIGIGTSSPGSTLEIEYSLGSAAISSPNDIASYQLVLDGAGGSVNDGAGIVFTRGAFPTGSIVGIDSGPNQQGSLLFFVNGAATTDDMQERMRINSVGNIGIGTAVPSTALEVNGYTKLGSDAPAVKMKKFTGTTAAAEGGAEIITHGLDESKIIGFTVVVKNDTNYSITQEYSKGTGNQFHIFQFETVFWITNHATLSESILSRPYTLLVWYEE